MDVDRKACNILTREVVVAGFLFFFSVQKVKIFSENIPVDLLPSTFFCVLNYLL